MQQTEADGVRSWFRPKKASPTRPAEAAHLWVAPKNSEKTPVQEIHELKQIHKAEVVSLQTKINRLNDQISIKDRALTRVNADNSKLHVEISHFKDIETILWKQQEEIQSLKKQLPHKVVWDKENDIASA
jgi:chromosome segregation ATPase